VDQAEGAGRAACTTAIVVMNGSDVTPQRRRAINEKAPSPTRTRGLPFAWVEPEAIAKRAYGIVSPRSGRENVWQYEQSAFTPST
jgi:hypothetical protein